MQNNKKAAAPASALFAAHKESGLSQATIARKLGVTPGAVRQWIAGERPVPAERARALGKLLRVSPAKISDSYASINPDEKTASAMDGQVREEIDALQAVVGGLMAIAVVHRPLEAAAVAAAIRKEVPKKLRENHFLQKLLEALDAGLSQGQ
jgi:transcriptional regulator with XRE-family HTH domain